MKSLAVSLVVGILVGAQFSLYNVPPLMWLPAILALVVGARFVSRMQLSLSMICVAMALVGVMRLTQNVDSLEAELLSSEGETRLEHYRHSTDEFRKSLLTPYFESDESTSGAVANAMILGDKSGITKALRQTYSDSGASHVIALSGMHLAIVSAILFLVLFKVPLFFHLLPKFILSKCCPWLEQSKGGAKRKVADVLVWMIPEKPNSNLIRTSTLLVVITVWAYTFLVGMSPSVVRASTMLTIVSLGGLMRRHVSLVHSLALAAFVILLVSPLSLFDVGFQMSFLAVLGIALYYRPLNGIARRFFVPRSFRLKRTTMVVLESESKAFSGFQRVKAWCAIHLLDNAERVLRLILSCVCLTISAQLLVMPLVAYYFHQLPTYGIVTSLVVAFTATAIVWCGVVLLLLSLLGMLLPALVSPSSVLYAILVAPVAAMLSWLVSAQNVILAHISAMPYAVMRCGELSVAQLVVVYIIIASLTRIVTYCKVKQE